MKKLVTTLCLLGATASLAACGWFSSDDEGYVDTQPPYSAERSASTAVPAPAPEPAPAPVVMPEPAPIQSAEPAFERGNTK
jgi:hypothetical protein